MTSRSSLLSRYSTRNHLKVHHTIILLLSVIAFGTLSTTSLAYADSVQVIMGAGTASNTNCGDQCYVPNTVSVAVGTKVEWKNSDSVAHTATANDGSFDTSLVNAGASASNTFNSAGTYPYMCVLHPWMKGTVIVGDPSVPLTPTPPPEQNPIQPSTDSPTEIRLTINGKINPTSIDKKLDVTLQIVGILINGQSDNTISVKQVRPQSDGTYSDSIILGGPLWTNYGDYKVIARYGSLKADTTFTFDGKSTEILASLPALERPVETKKGAPIDDTPIKNEQQPTPTQQPPQDVQLTISGKISQSSMQAGYDVALQVIAANGNTVTTRQIPVESDGSYSTQLLAGGPLWASKGNYKITAIYGSLKADTTFTFDGKSNKIQATLPTIGKLSGGDLTTSGTVPSKTKTETEKKKLDQNKSSGKTKEQIAKEKAEKLKKVKELVKKKAIEKAKQKAKNKSK